MGQARQVSPQGPAGLGHRGPGSLPGTCGRGWPHSSVPVLLGGAGLSEGVEEPGHPVSWDVQDLMSPCVSVQGAQPEDL